MSGRLVQELEYHFSDGAFVDGPDANNMIRYYQKMDQLAKYKLANNSNFTVFGEILLTRLRFEGETLIRSIHQSPPNSL